MMGDSITEQHLYSTIEFQQKDNALPFFPDGDAKNILQWVPVPGK